MQVALAAHRSGLGYSVTSFLDTAVGETAALHLAAALPATRSACGLATRALFAADVASAQSPSRGQLALPGGVGFGIEPRPNQVTRCARGETWTLGA
jgi:O-succinylbenzoate synthase